MTKINTDLSPAVEHELSRARTLIERSGRFDPIMRARGLHHRLPSLHDLAQQTYITKRDRLELYLMIRRFERIIGQAIKQGQDEGKIAKRGSVGGIPKPGRAGSYSKIESNGAFRGDDLVLPRDVLGTKNASDLSCFYDMAEPVTEEEFETIIESARDEGIWSRASFIAKLRKVSKYDRNSTVKQIANLAKRGYSDDQIAKFTDLKQGTVRTIARRHNIDLPGYVATRNISEMNDDHIATRTVETLEGVAIAVEMLDPSKITKLEEVDGWESSVAKSIRTLIKFHKQLKELAHGQRQ